MFKLLLVFTACFAFGCASKLAFLGPKAYAAPHAALPYTNIPLYAAGAVPLGYAGPYSGRYIAGVQHATYGSRYVAPAVHAAPYVGSFASPHAVPYAAAFATPYAAPYGAAFGTPYVAGYRAPYRASYAYGSPVIG